MKGNGACNNMVAKILPVDTLSTLGFGSKGQNILFSESSHVAYKINGIEHIAS